MRLQFGISSLMLAASILTILAACDPKTNGVGSPATGLRLDLRSQALAATPLTAAQKAEIQAISKSQTEFTPDNTLYFDRTKDADENKKSLARLNPTGKSYLALVKKKCTMDPDGNQTTGEAAAGKSTTVLNHESVQGTNCPIAYDSTSKAETNYSTIDATSGVVSATMHFEGLTSSKVNDAKMALNTYIVDTELSTSGDMTYTDYKSNASDDNVIQGSKYQKFDGKGTMATVDQKTISLTLTMEAADAPGLKAKQELVKLNLPSGASVVLWVQSLNGQDTTLVNGESYTQERLKSELGWFGNSLK